MSDIDFVNFKVYLREATPGQGERCEIRRFNVVGNVSTSLIYLQEKIANLFPRWRSDQLTLSWIDSDGDDVLIGSDEELLIAFVELGGPLYTLTVNVRTNKVTNVQQNDTKGELHSDVCCDRCDKDIRGFRYKCIVCPDYDLCRNCEVKGTHPGHNMLRISCPANEMPIHLFRRLSKMHEKMHKRGACNEVHMHHEEAHGETFDPYLGDGKYLHEVPHMPISWMRRGGRCKMRGGGRLWESMMNGWRGEDATANNTTQAAKASKDHKINEDNIPGSGFVNRLPAASSGCDYLRNIGNMVTATLDPLGVDVLIDIEHGGQRTNIGKPDERPEEEPVEKPDAPSVIEEPIVRHLLFPEIDKESSSDDDEWTVLKYETPTKKIVNIPINLEHMEENVVMPKNSENIKQSIILEPKAKVPITENAQPAKIFFAAPDGTIYSELPKEEPRKKEEPTEVTSTSTTALTYHPNPRIQVALQAMLTMGFTNEEGWLTHRQE